MALGAGGTGFVNGYGDGALAGALVAGTLAVIAALAIPASRPGPARHAAVH